jgi:hypothetical protein
MVFHGTGPDKLAGKLEDGVEVLSHTNAVVVLFTGPDGDPLPAGP